MLLGWCLLGSPGTSFWERGVDGEHRGVPGPLLSKAPACRSVARVGRMVAFCSRGTRMRYTAEELCVGENAHESKVGRIIFQLKGGY